MASIEKRIIGDCTLFLGDCADILPMIDQVDALITDPPYMITASGGGIGGKRSYLKDIKGHIDSGFDISMLSSFTNWLVFCGKFQITQLINFAEAQGLRWQILTWNKNNPTPLTNGNYLPDTEYMIHAFKRHDYEAKSRFVVGNVEKSPFNHPTVKPLYVMKRAVKSASIAGQTVLDPFMGSGSTGVACAALGRSFIGIEINPDYFAIACERIEKAYAQADLFMPPPKPMQQRAML